MKRFLILMLTLLSGYTLMAQGLTGTVLKKGKPKKGVVVWLKKADKSATTDKEGRFAFESTGANDTLQIAVSAKYDALVAVGNSREVTVSLNDKDYSVKNVGDVDVERTLPYVQVTAKSSGGVNHELIMRSGFRSVSEVLKNCVAGIVVSEGMTGSSIRVRGINSINSSNEPLFVVDGVAMQGTDIDAIVPVETVESIEVLKDGGGYGVRGANGVIVITTIKGGTE